MRRQQPTTKAGKGDTHVGRPGSRDCNFKVVLSPTARPFLLCACIAKTNCHASRMAVCFLRFSDKFFAALRTADADLPAMSRHTDGLFAFRAAEVAVMPIGQPCLQPQKRPILLLTLRNALRKRAAEQQREQNEYQHMEQRINQSRIYTEIPQEDGQPEM